MKILKALWVPVLSLASFSSASATVINYQGPDYTRGTDITLSKDGANVTYFAGMANIFVDGSLTAVGAFCVDIDTTIWNGTHNVITSDPSVLSNGGRVAWLLANMLGTISNVQQYAGLQLAIWDIVEDNANGLDTGRIAKAITPSATDAAVLAAANGFLAASADPAKVSNLGTVYRNLPGDAPLQSLMTPGPVPEPATVGLVGIALIAFGIASRRQAK